MIRANLKNIIYHRRPCISSTIDRLKGPKLNTKSEPNTEHISWAEPAEHTLNAKVDRFKVSKVISSKYTFGQIQKEINVEVEPMSESRRNIQRSRAQRVSQIAPSDLIRRRDLIMNRHQKTKQKNKI